MADFNCKLALENDHTIVYTAANGQPLPATKITLDDLTKMLLNRFNYWVGEDKHCDRDDLELLGRFLYNVLLPSDPDTNLRNSFEADYRFFLRQKTGNDRFRVTLELHEEARELAKYPWEFLFTTLSDGFFLAGEKTDLILTRFVPKVPDQIRVKKEEPLRILVIFSHPRELPDIHIPLTRDVISEITKLKHIEVRLEENPTYNKLYALMNGNDDPADAGKSPEKRTRFKPDILHFIGHGEPGKVALIRNEDDIQRDLDDSRRYRDADWRDAQQVLSLFANHPLRLVFLHACDGAKPDLSKASMDLARELVYAKVPVVVAMQYTIKNKDAALFARTFYEEIRNGSPIDEAVRAGREALGAVGGKKAWSDRSFGTPVVYMQSESEKALIEVDRESLRRPAFSAAGHNPYQKIPCPNPRCDGSNQLDVVVCVLCDHELMSCPGCQKEGKNNVMSKTIGKCGKCRYHLPPAKPVQFGPGTTSERKDEAQPAVEPQPLAAPQPSSPGTYR